MFFKKIMMCEPRYYNVIHPQMNYHMKMKRHVNYNLAMLQWEKLVSILIANNVKINFQKPVPNLVDMVFTANAGLIYRNKALISNFTAQPRVSESFYHNSFFLSNKFDTYNMITKFEGAGDALFSDLNTLWLGHGFRTENEAKFEIADIIGEGIQINSLKLIRPEWYHLDTCFCPIGKDKLLLYREAFDEASLQTVFSHYDKNKCIFLSEEDAINFSGNTIVIENSHETILIGHKYSDTLKTDFSEMGLKFIECNMSELLLSGGSTKCCVLNLGGE